MKKHVALPTMLLACACACLAFAHSVRAESDGNTGDNENEDNGIRTAVQGPVQAANCTATPPTVQILGLTIDVSKLVTDSTDTSTGTSTGTGTSTIRDQNGNDGDVSNGDNGGDGQNDDGDDEDGTSCSSIVGLTVKLGLLTDQAPLQAINGQ